MIFSSPVPGAYAGMSVTDYLSKRFTYLDRESWLLHVVSGRVTLNGIRCETDALVGPGDITGFEPPDFQEPPANLDFRVIYEDEWLMAIDKPGNLLVHRAGKSVRNNLIYQIRHREPSLAHADIVNRLDRETSGVVLVSKNKTVLGALHRQLAAGRIGKQYDAIVRGHPAHREMTIELPIGRDRDSGRQFRHMIDKDDGKPAVTHLTEIRAAGPDHCLLLAKPVTGRTHQIRLHCAAAGCPIVGDRLYGPRPEASGFSRQALHCRELSFVHPTTGKSLIIAASMPADMEEHLGRLEPGG